MEQLREAASVARSILLVIGLLSMPAHAQNETLVGQPGSAERAARRQDRTFGTQDAVAHVITAAEFEEVFPNGAWVYLVPGGAPQTKYDPSTNLMAGIRLPAGALVQAVELEACDTTNTAGVTVTLNRSHQNGLDEFLVNLGTGGSAMPGCGFFSGSPAAPITIDNLNNAYYVVVSAPNATASFAAVRIFYKLQVSAAPAVATFGDVPTTHPFFPFVEALVNAGVTAGCGGGNYCPDAPLTRGQMAVFLSRALGLHFAP